MAKSARAQDVEIHPHQEIIGILIAGQVRLNHGRGSLQHVLEPIEEQGVHVSQMTRVLVRGPAARGGASLQDTWRHFAHEGHHDVWGATQCVEDGAGGVHR